MASGWAADGAVQDQIDSTVDDAVQRAREALGQRSERYCQECGEAPRRAAALTGVRFASPARPNKTKTRGRQPVQPARQQRQPVALALSAPLRPRGPLAPSVHHES